ncbi:putative ankyrin repeat protein RF_0381 [Chelonus insularis]|uniref:putative ankyrin repeat protein RF_0381 n=1 Tax=Chelonus insularis TaxID=460826 RepID=UPI00158E8D1A|nr:putative ankyrin repeat protein RF_0381 [Chelonus insularis]
MKKTRKKSYRWSLSLREAIESRNYNYLKNYLVDERNIHTREADGSTALQIALLIDDIEMVRFLLEHEADPNQCYVSGNWEGCFPLHFALSVRSSAMAMLLIDYGADIFAKSPSVLPAICVAIINNRLCVLRYLMNNGLSPDTLIDDNISLLSYAVLKGNIRIVRCILAYKPSLNLHQNQQALLNSIHRSGNCSKRLVKMLYKYGFTLQPAEINPDLIYKAIINGHYEAVQDLLKLGVSPDFKISSHSQKEKNEQILHNAVRSGEIKIVRLLLENGANVNLRNENGITPIINAAWKNNLGMIKLLLKYGADVTNADSSGRTVLHFTIMGCIDHIYTSLTFCMDRTKAKIVKLLISKGADVNVQKYDTNSSPLHFAAWLGIPDTIQVLLAHGARMDLINSLHLTPLKCARSEMIDLITEINYINHRDALWTLKLSTLKLLEQHVYQLYRIGLPVCPRDLKEVDANIYKLKDDAIKMINNEIRFMKKTRILHNYITLYCFLTSTDEKAAKVIRNEASLKSLKAMLRHPVKFPQYAKLIRNKLTVALNERNIYTREADGSTALQIALLIDDIEMVRFLLEHEADPNQCYVSGNWEGCFPLHFALSVRSSAMAMLLIEYGADIFAKSPSVLPAICVAIINNRLCVLRYLMNNGLSPDTLIDDNISLLSYAVLKGNIRIVRCILAYKPNVNLHQNQQALLNSIHRSGNCSKRLVKMLYKYGFTLQPAEINPDLIYKAIINGHYEAVQDLLKLGVSPDFKISSHLQIEETEHILHSAVRAEDIKIVRLLLENGANVHLRDFHEQTPILIAAGTSNLCMIKLLLKYGADVTDADRNGHTVLHIAIMECMEYIYEHMNFCMNKTKTRIISQFATYGANVNARKYGPSSSPLDFAAWIGIPGAVQILLAYGARVDEVNSVDMTPLKYARSEMADLITGVNFINHREALWTLKLSTLKLLEHHVHRLYRIGLPVCPRDLEEVDANIYKWNDDVIKMINNEIRFMKKTRILHNYITLYCFLTSTDEKAAKVIRNEASLKSLKAMLRHPVKFPQYAKLIRNKLTVALSKKKLDTVTFRLMKFFFKEKKLPLLPDECIEHIASFLSDKDKETVINQFT